MPHKNRNRNFFFVLGSNEEIDLIMLLSTNKSQQGFSDQKQVAMKFLEKYQSFKNLFSGVVIDTNQQPRTGFHLEKISANTIGRMNGLTYFGNGANLKEAFNLAEKLLLTNRPESRRYSSKKIVFYYDKLDSIEWLKESLNQLSKKSIKVVSVGVGRDSDVLKIAGTFDVDDSIITVTDPQDSNKIGDSWMKTLTGI